MQWAKKHFIQLGTCSIIKTAVDPTMDEQFMIGFQLDG